ncbi:unnamed protein product [Pedinophyceae sp. YPF-701]|nr:unnamed protein product [Pedinophyceae sp. YPF-701]
MGERVKTLEARIKELDKKLVQHREAIKRTRPGPGQEVAKKRALQVLKQKRMYEQQMEQVMQQQFNVEATQFATEQVKDSVTQVEAMRAAQVEFKAAVNSKELDLSEIDKFQDEMADLMDYQREIQDALGRSYDLPDEVDESELMGELEALEAEMGETSLEETADGVPSYLADLPELPEAGENQAEEEAPQPAMAEGQAAHS